MGLCQELFIKEFLWSIITVMHWISLCSPVLNAKAKEWCWSKPSLLRPLEVTGLEIFL